MESGKYYKWVGTKKPKGWNDKGLMDFMLDGKPRKFIGDSDYGYFIFSEEIKKIYKKNFCSFYKKWYWLESKNFKKVEYIKDKQYLFNFT